MPRVKLSEFKSKMILLSALSEKYGGFSVDLDQPISNVMDRLSPSRRYVIKVDQAEKKRGLNGLVYINQTKKQSLRSLSAIKAKGYKYALIEPFIEHEQSEEKYFSLSVAADGTELRVSNNGGVDVESKSEFVSTFHINGVNDLNAVPADTIPHGLLVKIFNTFIRCHMTLLEMNPYLIRNEKIIILDAAVEVDDAAEFFVESRWTKDDIRVHKTNLCKQEQIVQKLNNKSPASFSLKVLNSNGKFFLLLSGGGASVVAADEIASHGKKDEIGNYGEYSGNPSEEETYQYAKQVLELALMSNAENKKIIIAGGIANFTDVAKTFKGIISAIRDFATEINQQKIEIHVRRGGPNQEVGLEMMKNYLESAKIKNWVHGPSMSLAAFIEKAVS